MKLIWLSAECPYPPNTGGRMVTWKRIEKLSQRHDIFLFSIVDSERDFDYIDNLKKCCKEVYLYQRKRSLRVMVQSLFKPFPAVSRWNTGLSKKLEEKCEQIDPDYIVVDFPQMLGNLSTDIMCRWKVVLNQHNIEHLTLKSIAKTQSSFLKNLLIGVQIILFNLFQRRNKVEVLNISVDFCQKYLTIFFLRIDRRELFKFHCIVACIVSAAD